MFRRLSATAKTAVTSYLRIGSSGKIKTATCFAVKNVPSLIMASAKSTTCFKKESERMEEMSKTAMETIVDYNQQDDTAHVFTYDPALQKKMDKLCADHPDEVQLSVECNGSKNYTFPKSWLKITAPRKKKVTA